MKFSISLSTFRAAVCAVAESTDKRLSSNLPILGNLLLVATPEGLSITGFDLDLEMQMAVPCEVSAPGKVTLSASRLAAIAKTATGDKVDVEVTIRPSKSADEITARLTVGGVEYELPGLSAEEFPHPLEVESDAKVWTFKADVLRNALALVAPSQETNLQLFQRCGVCMNADKTIEWVATDGRILSIFTSNNDGPSIRTTLPSRFVGMALRALNVDGQAVLRVGQNCVALEVGATLLRSKLIDATFPNYVPIVRIDSKGSATLEREPFLRELQKVSVVGENMQGNWIAPRFELDGRNLIITQHGKEGTARSELPVKATSPLTIRLDQKYLQAALRGLSEDEVTMEFADPKGLGPIAIKAGAYTGIIMPLRDAA